MMNFPRLSVPILLLCALLAQATQGPVASAQQAGRSGREAGTRMLTPAGNPSALIAAEIAFARAAQDKGQWTAFEAFAADDAQMFVPRRTSAKAWLHRRANPPQAVRWQAQQAWVSCDGSAGVTFGAWQGTPPAQGWFSTVWQRQRKKGNYLWVLDQGDDLASPLPTPDWIEGKVADCPPRHRPDPDDDAPGGKRPSAKPAGPPPQAPLPAPLPPAPGAPDEDTSEGRAEDGSLAWRTTVSADGARDWRVWLWKDGTMQEVLHRTAAAPAASPKQGG